MLAHTRIITVVLGAGFVAGGLALAEEQVGGGEIVFANDVMGNVTLSHAFHVDKGNACTDCHPAPFQMAKGTATITMAEINAGNFCGKCHAAGGKSFAATECARCHKK